MKYLIIDGEVVGRVGEGEEPMGQATLEPGPYAADISQLYFDAGEVKLKPEPPGPDAWWDRDAKGWREPQPLPEVPLAPDWDGFAAALRGGPTWAKFYAAGTKDLRCNLAGTLLLTTLTSGHNLADLEFAIAELLAAMAAASGVTELTTNQKATLDGLLVTHRLKAAD
jgi:hypothetical protein